MRIIRNNKCVKIVPKKFEPILDGYEFHGNSKRLDVSERYALLQRLIKHTFKDYKGSDPQIQLASAAVKSASQVSIIKTHKRDSTDWRIEANGLQVRVSESLVGDCPQEFLYHKHEL